MPLRTVCAACLTLGLPGWTAAQAAEVPQDAGIAPFSAHYVAEWKGITVGSSDLQLERDGPDRYLYKWTISARGIFRIVYSSDLTQKSWFSVVADHVRPDRYLAEEGASSVSLAFDWDTGHARGMSEEQTRRSAAQGRSARPDVDSDRSDAGFEKRQLTRAVFTSSTRIN